MSTLLYIEYTLSVKFSDITQGKLVYGKIMVLANKPLTIITKIICDNLKPLKCLSLLIKAYYTRKSGTITHISSPLARRSW